MYLFLLLLFLSFTLTFASPTPTVYLIRHGEKPASGNGLTAQGQQRAECLINVFAPNTIYNIGYIIAEQPESNGKRSRPYDTVLPLSQSLNLTIDTSCEKTDSECVAALVKAYNGTGNVLVCWEHGELTDIVESLGDKKAPEYPDDRYVFFSFSSFAV